MKTLITFALIVGYYYLLALVVTGLFHRVISFSELIGSVGFVVFGGFIAIAMAVSTRLELEEKGKL